MAIVLALFMMLAMSVLGTSLMFVSQTETLSSNNYLLMSQARYGAESGVHRAANFLLNDYNPPGVWYDPISNYDTTVSPVTYNGQPVVLSAHSSVSSNYPVSSVRNAFRDDVSGTVSVRDYNVSYRAHATLRSMRQITDAYSQQTVTLQTWDIVAEGTINGARPATVEVSSTMERETRSVFPYAVFATDNGCSALSFAGGATTDSYDSGAALVDGLPVLSNNFGNVGTNGNLTEVGNPTTVNGSLSTPRIGVGACTSTNVTAQTILGQASVTEGINQLSQPVSYPTPAAPNPLPPTTSQTFQQNGGCPSDIANCAVSTNGATITPGSPTATHTMGNVRINANSVLHLNAGIYVLNSLRMEGSSKIVIDSGPVVVRIAGVNETTPLIITGNGIVNTSFDPSQLQFVYGGTNNIQLTGGDQTAATVYAPRAIGSISGGADLYGAVVVRRMTATGGASIHYDRRLRTSGVTAGNYMLTAFSWRNY